MLQPDGGIRMLSVDIAEQGADVPNPLWQMRNQHFGMWEAAQVEIPAFDDMFQIIVAAERGDFDQGWAAFDDFELVTLNQGETCNIYPPEAVPHVPSRGDCTFQHGLCDWVPVAAGDTDDMFDWKRIHGNQSLENPHPETDHYGDPIGTCVMKLFCILPLLAPCQ